MYLKFCFVHDLRASCLHLHKANPDTVPTSQTGVWSACCLCGLLPFCTGGTFWYHLLFYSIVFATAKMELLGQRDGMNFRIFSRCFQTMPTKLLLWFMAHENDSPRQLFLPSQHGALFFSRSGLTTSNVILIEMTSTIWKYSATSMVSLRLLGPGSSCLNPQNSWGGVFLTNKKRQTFLCGWNWF